MIQNQWDGVTVADIFSKEVVELRHQLADAARDYHWSRTLELLEQHPDWVNASRLGGKAWYSPLHQAAHGNAPIEVAQKLLEWGAWRTLTTANGERAVDIAQRKGHNQLVPLLAPVYLHKVPTETLQTIQNHFHEVI